MTYVLPLQTMKINFSGPKIHSTAEESEGYTAGSASPPCFHPGTDFEPTFWRESIRKAHPLNFHHQDGFSLLGVGLWIKRHLP